MSEFYSAAEATRETFQRFTNLLSGKMGPGIYTGFERLDSHLQGFQTGTVTVLSSKPAGGKTAYALNLVRSIFHKHKTARVLYFSLDLDHIQLMTRLLCMECGLEISRIQQGDIEHKQMPQLSSAAQWLKGLQLWVDSSCNLSIEELDRKIRLFIEKYPPDALEKEWREQNNQSLLDLIIIDSLELLKYQDSVTAVKKIRLLAKEIQTPILLLTSCSSPNTPCKKNDLAEGLVENSDTLLFLERERQDLHNGEKLPVELNIVRNTCGFTGKIPMEYDPKTMLFEEIKQNEEVSGGKE